MMNALLRFAFFKIWKGVLFLFLLGLITSGLYFSFFPEEKGEPDTESILADHDSIFAKKESLFTQFYHVPLYFEKNEGQIDSRFKYLTRCPGHVLYFAPNEVFISLSKNKTGGMFSALNIQFVNANPHSLIKGIDEQACKSNYFIGNDTAQWRRSISNYAKISYQNLYPGIDAIFYGNARQLEYDFYIAPGVNPKHVHMHLEGAKKLSIDIEGNLQIVMGDEQIVQMKKPLIYQELAGGNKVSVPGEFVLLAAHDVGFVVSEYDTSKQLVIDPILTYSSYLGGNGSDNGLSIAVDSEGNAYVTGFTGSSDFPTTSGVYQSELGAGAVQNAFVTKFNPTGNALIYSTYLGSTGTDSGNGIVVNSEGQAYITGSTDNGDFPVTAGAFQTVKGGIGQTGFVTLLNSSGSDLIYSTFLGGTGITNVGYDIDIDASGNAYVTGITGSSDFPTTPGAFQTSLASAFRAAFLSKLNPGGTALVYSTYLGAESGSVTQGEGLVVDSEGYVYLTGYTDGSFFPTTSGAFQTSLAGTLNGFVTKFNPAGSALAYSTLFGGSGEDFALSIDVDAAGHAYVTGQTSSPNFPVTAGAFQTTFPSSSIQAFLTKLNSTGTALDYSTYLGGSLESSGFGVAVDRDGNAYIGGTTLSPNFPVTSNAIQPTIVSTIQNGFITKMNPAGSALLFSTYFSGTGGDNEVVSIALDANDNAYVTGYTNSTDFPTTSGAFQTSNGGGTEDGFVAKLALGAPAITAVSPQTGPVMGGTTVSITGTNLGNTTGVFFGNTPATSFTIDSDTQITAASPPGSLGPVDITVVAVGTSPITTADQFTYILTPTTTTLTVSPNPAAVGEPIVLIASIAPSSATGSVTFFDGAKLLAVKTLSNGTATFTADFLKPGKHFIVASYSGDNTYLGSTSSVIVVHAKPVVAAKKTRKNSR